MCQTRAHPSQCGRSCRKIGKRLRKSVLDLSPRWAQERVCTRRASRKGGVPCSSSPPKRQARQEDPFAQRPQLRLLLDSRDRSSAFTSFREGCWPFACVRDLKEVKDTNSATVLLLRGLRSQQGRMATTSPSMHAWVTTGGWCPKPQCSPMLG